MNDDPIPRKRVSVSLTSGVNLRLALARWFGITTTDAERDLDTEADSAEEIVGHVLSLALQVRAADRR